MYIHHLKQICLSLTCSFAMKLPLCDQAQFTLIPNWDQDAVASRCLCGSDDSLTWRYMSQEAAELLSMTRSGAWWWEAAASWLMSAPEGTGGKSPGISSSPALRTGLHFYQLPLEAWLLACHCQISSVYLLAWVFCSPVMTNRACNAGDGWTRVLWVCQGVKGTQCLYMFNFKSVLFY